MNKPEYIQLNEFGQEIPDDTPIVIHVQGHTITDFDRIRDFIRRELREHQTGEVETFDEANDFDVYDDLFPVSAHEYNEDTEAADREVIEAEKARSTPQDNSVEPGVSESSGSPASSPATP